MCRRQSRAIGCLWGEKVGGECSGYPSWKQLRTIRDQAAIFSPLISSIISFPTTRATTASFSSLSSDLRSSSALRAYSGRRSDARLRGKGQHDAAIIAKSPLRILLMTFPARYLFVTAGPALTD